MLRSSSTTFTSSSIFKATTLLLSPRMKSKIKTVEGSSFQYSPKELARLRHNMVKLGFRSKRSVMSTNSSWTRHSAPSTSSSSATDPSDFATKSSELHQQQFNILANQEPPTLREQFLLKKMERKRKKKVTDIPLAVRQKMNKAKHYSKEFETIYFFKEEDVTEKTARGHGPGGQATNRRMQTCQIRHIPSGLHVRMSKYRSLYMNRKAARYMLSLRLERLMFGKYSKLGLMMTQNRKSELRNKRKKDRLNKIAENYESRKKRHHAAIEEKVSSSSSSSITKTASSVSPFPVLSLADVMKDKEEFHTTAFWNCIDFNPIIHHINNNNNVSSKESSLTFSCACDQSGGMLVVDFEKYCHPKRRSELLQSPFVENWWKFLELAATKCRNNNNNNYCDDQLLSAAGIGKSTTSSATASINLNRQLMNHIVHVCGTCCCVPSWFCCLFPSLPSTTVFGPQPAWECRERSYLRNNNNSCSHSNNIKHYLVFFEMFGLKYETDDGSDNTIASLDRDEGLNWVEARNNKILQLPDYTVILWTHVFCSATEMMHENIKKVMKEFIEKRTKKQYESHEGVRKVFKRIEKKIAVVIEK